MKILEASKDISWVNSISSPKTSLKEESTQKHKEKGKNTLEESGTGSGCAATRLGYTN